MQDRQFDSSNLELIAHHLFLSHVKGLPKNII